MIRPPGEDGTVTTRARRTQLNHRATRDGWLQQAHREADAALRQSRGAGGGLMKPGQLSTPSSKEERRGQQ